MKKLLVVLMAVILVMSYTVGCTPEENTPENENPITDEQPGGNGDPGDMEDPGEIDGPGDNNESNPGETEPSGSIRTLWNA